MKIFYDKKAQLGWIEFKYFFFGLIVGLIVLAVLVGLSCNDVLIPKLGLICG